jgi:hypothetical protein
MDNLILSLKFKNSSSKSSKFLGVPMNKQIVKNIYDRLYRKGINVSKDIIEAKLIEIAKDVNNITSAEKEAVVDFIVNSTSKAAGKAALPEENEPAEMFIYQPGTNNQLAKQEDKQEDKAPLTYKEISSIVYDQVEEMNLDLKTSQVKAIVGQLVEMNVDATNAINTAISVIKQYIDYQENEFTNQFQKSVNELVIHANTSFQRRNAIASDAFTKLQMGLEESTNHFKSSCRKFEEDITATFKIETAN